MKIKNRKQKKELIGKLYECRSRVGNIYSHLRDKDLKYLDNRTVAELNDMAYKAIKSGKLNKLADKRALQNETKFRDNEKQAHKHVKKLDFDKLQEEQKDIVAEIGQCPLTVCDVIEAMKEGDSFAIGLKVSRPEGTIADPSLLNVEDIYPTYISVDGFLESAQF